MKKVIALRGLGNAGKSSTLWKVYELLIANYALVRARGRRVNVSVVGDLNDVNTSVIITINGVRIGIESVGDNPDLLRKSLRELEFKGCAIIVCATRPAKKFRIVVEDLKRSCYEVEWVNKSREGDPDKRKSADERTAQEIVDKIEDLL